MNLRVQHLRHCSTQGRRKACNAQALLHCFRRPPLHRQHNQPHLIHLRSGSPTSHPHNFFALDGNPLLKADPEGNKVRSVDWRKKSLLVPLCNRCNRNRGYSGVLAPTCPSPPTPRRNPGDFVVPEVGLLAELALSSATGTTIIAVGLSSTARCTTTSQPPAALLTERLA